MAYGENTGVPAVMNVAPAGYGAYAPMMGNGYNNGFGGDWSWIILLILIANGGWGGFGAGMMGAGMMGGWELYPWLNQSNQISDGFQNQALNTSVNGIADRVTSGFGDVQNSLCAGFAGVNATVNNAQNVLAQQLYTNQIADLERSFAAQTANAQGMNSLQSQLANCCCENRLASADLKYTVATENCADRAALSDGLRDVIANNTANTNAIMTALTGGIQAIKDQLCQQEIDALKAQNVNLQNQVNMQSLAASQAAQTAALIADNTAQTQYVVNRVAPYPIPAYQVANPYGYNAGCGCAA